MSPRLPKMTGRNVIKILQNKGFQVSRIKGSHHFLRHCDGRTTVVPVHSGEIIGAGLFSKILKDCDLTPDDFRK